VERLLVISKPEGNGGTEKENIAGVCVYLTQTGLHSLMID
jgi:hypothetical protein